jgi:hypothetical protein
MSEVDQIDNVMTLEDLFLSAEFGQTVVGTPTPVVDDMLFREAPLGAPLLPLAAFPAATGIHDTTTHVRRNRAFATASGVAAALLLAVGVISGAGKPAKSNVQNALPPTTVPNTTPPSGTTQPSGGSSGGQTSGTPSGSGPGGSALIAELSSNERGQSARTGSAAVLAGHPAGTPTPPTSPTSPSTPSSGGTSPSGSVLSPVITLVGQVVVTGGNTVSGVATTLTDVAPPLAPVTGLVGGLGSTLSGLGNNLIAAA